MGGTPFKTVGKGRDVKQAWNDAQLMEDNREAYAGNITCKTDYVEIDVPEEFARELIATKKEGSGYKIVNGVVKARAQAIWFTNLDIAKRHEDLILYKRYSPEEYPKYVNYDAIEVSKTAHIPVDYKGKMGVPITFLDKYNPEQFEIIGLANDKREIDDAFVQGDEIYLDKQHKRFVGMVLKTQNGLRATYARIIIRNKRL